MVMGALRCMLWLFTLNFYLVYAYEGRVTWIYCLFNQMHCVRGGLQKKNLI